MQGHAGITFDSSIVSTPYLRGDILSFMSCRDMFHGGMDLDDSDTIAEIAWLVFSTIFSVAAQETNVFKIPVDAERSIPVTPLVWQEIMTYNNVSLGLTLIGICILIMTMAAHIYIVAFRYKSEYLFPIAPKPLENTWFFQYRSKIVDLIEKNIDHPEDLTLGEFNLRIRGFGRKYVFQKGGDDENWLGGVVDVAEDPYLVDVNNANGRDANRESSDIYSADDISVIEEPDPGEDTPFLM